MELNLLKTLGQIAGIGGLSVGLALLVFRDVIRKNIFPKFKDEALAYRLLRLIVVLSWSIAALGIVSWVSVRIFESRTADTISIETARVSGNLEVATETAYTEAIAKDPDNEATQLNIGMLKQSQGDFAAAAEHLGKAPDNRQARQLERRIVEKREAGALETEPNNDAFTANRPDKSEITYTYGDTVGQDLSLSFDTTPNETYFVAVWRRGDEHEGRRIETDRLDHVALLGRQGDQAVDPDRRQQDRPPATGRRLRCSGRREFLHAEFLALSLGEPQIVLHLLVEPALGSGVEGDRQAHRHLGADARSTVDDAR